MAELKDFYGCKVWRFHVIANPFEKFRMRNILEFLTPKGDQIFLDVGSGGGSYSRTIGEKSKVIALDISREALENARENVKTLTSVSFIVCSAEHLPIRDNGVDGVACVDVIEHLRNVDMSISEMSRVLKRGGKITIFTTCVANRFSMEHLLKPVFGRLLQMLYMKIGHLHAFSTAALLELLKGDFSVVKIQYMHGWIASYLNFLWGVAHLKSPFVDTSPETGDLTANFVIKALWCLLEKENELFKNRSMGGEIVLNAIKL